MLKKIFMVFTITIFVIVSLALCIIWDDSRVVVSDYSIYSKKVSSVFDGYKIAVISDFHNGDNHDKAIKAVKEVSPKTIVLIGDIISMNDENFDNVGKLLDSITTICPVYFVSGNNETWSTNENDFLDFLKTKDVIVINDEVVRITYKNSDINLVGFKDIVYADEAMRYVTLEKQISDLYNKIPNKDMFNVLLFHRANYFETVAKYGFDLVLSGHTHGGLVNLPYIKEKILNSKYNNSRFSKGYYRIENSQMIVSGGLESKIFVEPRVLNTPEVVSITLKSIK